MTARRAMTSRAASRLRDLGTVGAGIWGRLEHTAAGRFLHAFVAMRAVDRALALASKLFIAVLPISILSTALISGRSFGDQLVERFGLSGAGAQAARTLFAAPAQVQTGIGLLGLVILASSVFSFTRALERMYLDCWQLPAVGAAALRDRLSWLSSFVVLLAALSTVRAALAATDVAAVILLLSAVSGSAFFLWTPYILLGRRVSWRRLMPTALLTGGGLLALGIGSAIVMPELISHNTTRYGLIGFTFSVVSWLFCAALVLVSTAILGAVLDGERELPTSFWEA